MDLLNRVGIIGILVFVISSMMATGMGHTIGQILTPLRNPRLFLLTVFANFVIVPFGSLVLAAGLRLDDALGEGLMLLGTASGTPFVPKLTELARGDQEFAVGTLCLLTLGTLIYVPLILPVLLPAAIVDPWTVARPLLLFVLLPLAFGLFTKAYREKTALRFQPVFERITNFTLLPVVLLVSALNVDGLLHILGTRGWLFGGPRDETRRALALSTGLRNFAVAMVLASESFSDRRVEIMVVVTAIIALLVVVPLSHMWRRWPKTN